jgi:hypothetical protein
MATSENSPGRSLPHPLKINYTSRVPGLALACIAIELELSIPNLVTDEEVISLLAFGSVAPQWLFCCTV